MKITSTITIATRALRANPVRSGLAMLGIVIGIASVIIVFSAGEGISSLIVGQVEAFGTDIIEAETKVPKKGSKDSADKGGTQSSISMAQGVQITTLNLTDMEDVIKLPNIANGYSGILGQEQASYGNELRKAILLGVSASYIDIDKSEVELGRFYTAAEENSLAQVIVLGSKIKEKLFGDADPIGKMVKIRKSKFEVIGTIKERGGMGGMNFDDYVYMPLKTLQKRLMGIDHVLYQVYKLKDNSIQDETADEIKAILRENHDITDPDKDDFNVTTMEEMLKILGTITGALTLLLLAIVAISLVVGGVGVMNIMYVVISERRREIGLRKAVGARQGDILFQFLLESIIITFVGGAAGVVLGILGSWGIAVVAGSYGLAWEFSVPMKGYVVAAIFSLVFGIFFGVYPARKAARLDPITALRSE